MSLTNAQLQTLKAAIAANPAWNNQPMTSAGAAAIAADMNLLASPAWIVWRTNVSRAEVYHLTSAEATTWNWTTYKNQAVAEQNAWTQMFMGDLANLALPNLRAGVSAIFTGSAQANAQAAHVLAIGKRPCTVAEKLFSSGTGTTATPATMTFEGALTSEDVQQARELP